MKNKKYFIVFLILFAFVTIISYTQSQNKKAVGLVSGKPGMNNYVNKAPGETKILKRPYKIAPPLIPHDISEFTITRETNDCLNCHLDGEEVDEGHIATKIPKSHFINKFTHKISKENVSGIRYNCLQCHNKQSNDKAEYFNKKKMKK